eukprot:CAMPEP_0197426908 /NCGR_PEP_ID=MMETSP1170-20131217/36623_1 /TAXON_ID=54406 /ORGANISM="Sarcinochrysis sp, Strain CCMP770" /LENGTH=72 /DNA_ID=CAMNT_0042954577 /DNA_START=1 /DNA_END=215 /DNA_ORIENTATION=-
MVLSWANDALCFTDTSGTTQPRHIDLGYPVYHATVCHADAKVALVGGGPTDAPPAALANLDTLTADHPAAPG